MWILVLFIIIVLFFIVYCSSKNHSGNSVSSTNRIEKIEDCMSVEDIKYQISYETQSVIADVEKNKEKIKKALVEANSNIDTAWLTSYDKLIKISSNLDDNLRYCAKQNLEQSKFQYYTGLHFRSMIAADITYKEYLKIDASFNEINKLIVAIAKNEKKINVSKAQIYSAKDSIKELRKVFLNKVHSLNHQTEILRDKIGDECGQRGKTWRNERMRNHK